jgi:cytochrome c5
MLMLAPLSLGYAAPAHAGEAGIQLKAAPQSVQVRARCSICHSADYIQMNSVFMNKATWEAEVRKMIKVMGAPIPETEVAEIVDYLVKNYGVE